MGGINSENRKTKRQRPKSLARLAACSAAFLLAGAFPAQGLAQHPISNGDVPAVSLSPSQIYPEDWAPGDVYIYRDGNGDPIVDGNGDPVVDEDRFLHDWSYAGYYYGEREPKVTTGLTYNVLDYGADNSGDSDAADATGVIQSAIDDAANAGGGIVYLPAGEYKLSITDGKRYALRIHSSNVVLQGAGEETKLYWAGDDVSRSTMIMVSPFDYPDTEGMSANGWSDNEIDPVLISFDVPNRSSSFEVDDASDYAAGDWVILRTDCTSDFARDHGMFRNVPGNGWCGDAQDEENPILTPGLMFYRQITKIDGNELTINVPTRYELKTRDNARIYKVDPHLENIGVENLQLGANETDSQSAGYHSNLIQFNHTIHSWVRNIQSYEPEDNNGYHMPSGGIFVHQSSFNTFDNIHLGYPQWRGGSGIGYLFQFRGGDNLLKNSMFEYGRHNISAANFFNTGNVILNTNASNGSHESDFHRHLSPSNLIDNISLYNEQFQLDRRDGNHGHTSTQSVFWNSKKAGGTATYIKSAQFGWGYVVGSSGDLGVNMDGNAHTTPDDHLEFEDMGETLWPQSLYIDQFRRRMERGEFLSTSLPFSAFNNNSVTNNFNNVTSDDFGGLINPPHHGTWYYDSRGGSVSVADFPSETDKSLLLVDESNENIVRAIRLFKERSTPIKVEFSVYPVTNTKSYFSVRDGGILVARIKISSNKIEYTDGNGSGGNSYGILSPTSATGQWYDFKMIVDPQTDTADYYLDGQFVGSGGFVNDVDSVNKFDFLHQGNQRGALYFDDFDVRDN